MTQLIKLCCSPDTTLAEVKAHLAEYRGNFVEYVNAKDDDGITALMYAACNGYIEIVEYLKSLGKPKHHVAIDTICIDGVQYKLTKI